MTESRRQFLKASGTVVGTGALAALAGCSGILGGGGGGGGSLGGFPNALYAPGTIRENDHYFFGGRAPIEIDEYEDEFDETYYENLESGFESSYEHLGLDFDEVEGVVGFNGNTSTILSGYQVPAEDVVDELEDNDYEEDDEYEGYRVFVGPEEEEAVGVGSNDIVIGRSTTVVGGSGVDVSGNGGSGSRQDLRSINYGESWQGVIDESDPEGYRGHYEPVTFEGSAGDIVTVDMYANDDTYLYLLDPDGQEVTYDDDGGDGLDSRISAHELQQSGEYTIIATSYSSWDTFSYTLTLTLLGAAIEPPSVVETIVDTRNGDETRYAEDSDAFAELSSQLDPGTYFYGSTYDEYDDTVAESGQFEGGVAGGFSYTVNGDTADVQYVVSFGDADDVDTDDVEDWTDEGSTFEDVDDISVGTSGRSVIVTGTIDTDDL